LLRDSSCRSLSTSPSIRGLRTIELAAAWERGANDERAGSSRIRRGAPVRPARASRISCTSVAHATESVTATVAKSVTATVTASVTATVTESITATVTESVTATESGRRHRNRH
jgi:hypothetical protein